MHVGLAQITVWMTLWYRKYAHALSREDQWRFQFAEQEARGKKVGFWRDANPKQPGSIGGETNEVKC